MDAMSTIVTRWELAFTLLDKLVPGTAVNW